MQQDNLFAAVDLGSNSFRMEIGLLENGRLRRLDYLKETVRQGSGLDSERQLSLHAMQQGWDCLARFGERIAAFHPAQVRAVATQTLREARNRDVFLVQANQALGFPIEVITGREEARLIYLGVSHLLPDSAERRLVVDIGGGSTEIILGQGHLPQKVASYRLGSVSWSLKHFTQGWSAAAFKAAEIAAQAILEETLSDFPRSGWDQAYGSSGTVGAVADILLAHGRSNGTISRENLDWLLEKLLRAKQPLQLRLEGLKDDRRTVIAGGLAVLRAVFDLLDIGQMQPAQGALRHGALFDLMDRDKPDTDVRDRMIGWLASHFGADAAHGQRVAKAAETLLRQGWGSEMLDAPQEKDALRQVRWAALVHEIGMQISHSDHHKHGAYILENTDLQGFTVAELHRLGLMVLGQRGKLRKLGDALEDPRFVLQLMALRLAVVLCHARREPDLRDVELANTASALKLQLTVPSSWESRFPQSMHLLREESVAWHKVGVELELGLAP